MPCLGEFPSFAWRNTDLSKILWQEVGNHVVKNCISLYGQNLNLQFADQQFYSRPRTSSFELVGWLSPKTHLKSSFTP